MPRKYKRKSIKRRKSGGRVVCNPAGRNRRVLSNPSSSSSLSSQYSTPPASPRLMDSRARRAERRELLRQQEIQEEAFRMALENERQRQLGWVEPDIQADAQVQVAQREAQVAVFRQRKMDLISSFIYTLEPWEIEYVHSTLNHYSLQDILHMKTNQDVRLFDDP